MNTFTTVIDRPINISVLLILLCLASACATQKAQQPEASVADKQLAPPEPEQVAPEPKQVVAKSGPESPTSQIYLGSDGKLAGTGSPDRPASEIFRIARGAHPKALSLPGLPKDKFGLIDWVSMVNKKIVNPVGSLQPDIAEAPPLDLDVLIESKGDFVQNVMFRHKTHVYWLDCTNCHEGIFALGKGMNKISMQEIVQGKWCGRCHGKVSFPLTDCNRCHSQPKQ